MTAWSAQHNGKFPDPYSKLKLDHEKNKEKKKKKKKDKHNPLETIEKSDNYALKQHDVNVKTVRFDKLLIERQREIEKVKQRDSYKGTDRQR
jgi:hypothetical protein